MTQFQLKAFKAVFLCLFIIFASLILFSAPDRVNQTLVISLIPCAGACYLMIKKTLPGLYGRPGKIPALLLTGLFLFMLSVSEVVRSPLLSSSLPLAVLYVTYLTCSSFIVIYFFLEYFVSNGDKGNLEVSVHYNRLKDDRRIYRLMPLYIAAAILFLAANYPFRPSPDAMTVYDGIMARNWSDWHPIGYVTFVRLCMFLASPVACHPFASCIVQTVLWLLTFHLLCGILYRCTGSARAVNLYRIANLVIFVPLMYLGIMYKDVLYSMCVLGFCAELYLFLRHKERGRKDFILITLFSIGVSLFRHMGIVTTVFPLLVLAVYFCLKKNGQWKKLIISAVFTFLAFFTVTNVYGSGILHMQKNPDYVKYTVPLYLIGNLSSGHPELFTEEDRQLMEEMMPYEDWVAAYNLDTYWADNLARDSRIVKERIYRVDEAYGREILKLNFRLLFRSPSAWTSALFRITSIVWQIGRPADGYEWTAAGYYVPEDRPDLADRQLVTTEKAITGYLGGLQYYLEEQPLLSFIYYRGGIWAFILIFLGVVLLLKRKPEFLICLLPPALITAMLMITCPSQDPRFVLPAMETAMFLLPAVFYDRFSLSER